MLLSQAEACVRALNELQSIFGSPQAPILEELHSPGMRYTLQHLTAWFDPWIHFYELMPQLIHPDSQFEGDEASADDGSEESSAAHGSDAEGQEGPESSENADTEKSSWQDEDRRVRLTYRQALRVCCPVLLTMVPSHTCSPKPTCGEYRGIATFECALQQKSWYCAMCS
jgi:hypothetical protein